MCNPRYIDFANERVCIIQDHLKLNLIPYVCFYRGKLFPEDVLDLLRKCNPPVGWGKLCPQTLAYKVHW